MKYLTFLGASSDIVTGSSYLISDKDGHGVLVDLGMFQGGEEVENHNFDPLGFEARELHSVLLTHAHLDHVGRLPLLTKNGFTGRIYMTAATKALAEIVLYDSANIASKEHDKPAIYNDYDVEDTMSRVEVIEYHKPFELGSMKITFKDAGHILGSASILIEEDGKKLVFSGDIGNYPEEIVRPTEFFDEADYVVMESTYGDKNHPDDHPDTILLSEINEVEKNGGVLLIPSFSIERTQVLLHKLDHFKRDKKIKEETIVYLDSPMGTKATNVYKSFADLFNSKLEDHDKHDDPFDFPGLIVTSRNKDSKKITEKSGSKVILAGSGMMSGGRILGHAKNYLSDPNNRLLIVGFQAEGTIGREIVEGAKEVKIKGEIVPVRAHVTEIYSMSAHADQRRLMEWIGKIKNVKKVFLIHGEKSGRDTLAEKITKELNIKEVEKPELKQTFEL